MMAGIIKTGEYVEDTAAFLCFEDRTAWSFEHKDRDSTR